MTIIPFPARAARRVEPTLPALLPDVLADFLLDMQVAGLRPLSRKKHRQELRRFGRWLDARQLHWCSATEDDLVAFLRTRAHLKTSTRAAAIGSLRVFYRWVVERHYLPVSPANGLRTPARDKPTPLALTKAQIRTLRDYLRSRAAYAPAATRRCFGPRSTPACAGSS